MPTLHFVSYTGERTSLNANDGDVIMQVAVQNGLPGIDGDCGGQCACATCHVYIDTPWADKLPAMEALEDQMLDLANERRGTSRLSCQLTVTPELDGIEIGLPEGQH